MVGAKDQPRGESSPEIYAVHLCYQTLLNPEPFYQKPTLIPSHDTSWLGNGSRSYRDTLNQILLVYSVVESTTLSVVLDYTSIKQDSRSQWPRGLRRRSLAARLLKSWVRIPPGAWMFVCCECCVLSGRGLCDELITRPEESYRLWCVVVFDIKTLKNEEAMTRVGSQRHRGKK